MFAIIETGGKQYKVKKGDRISIEKLSDEIQNVNNVTFDKVLLVVENEDGEPNLHVGAPYVASAKVTATIVDNYKGKKVVVYKYKSKKDSHKKKGHRQNYTKVEISDISI